MKYIKDRARDLPVPWCGEKVLKNDKFHWFLRALITGEQMQVKLRHAKFYRNRCQLHHRTLKSQKVPVKLYRQNTDKLCTVPDIKLV